MCLLEGRAHSRPSRHFLAVGRSDARLTKPTPSGAGWEGKGRNTSRWRRGTRMSGGGGGGGDGVPIVLVRAHARVCKCASVYKRRRVHSSVNFWTNFCWQITVHTNCMRRQRRARIHASKPLRCAQKVSIAMFNTHTHTQTALSHSLRRRPPNFMGPRVLCACVGHAIECVCVYVCRTRSNACARCAC